MNERAHSVEPEILPRELWKPTRAETLTAIETLLLSDISREARSAVREIEFEVIHGRKAS